MPDTQSPLHNPPAKLERIGWFRCQNANLIRPRPIMAEREYLELITAGTVFHQLDGREVTLTTGALFWEIPGDQTISKTTNDDRYQCLTVAFQTPCCTQRRVPLLTIIHPQARALELAQELFRAFHNPAVDRHMLCHYAFQRLLWEATSASIPNRYKLPNPIENAIQFIETHFSEPLTITDIATKCGLSDPHFHTLFRQHTGKTPRDYLENRRMQEARVKLAGTRDPVKNIACDCGYPNTETFCRAFKRLHETSPMAYRKANEINP